MRRLAIVVLALSVSFAVLLSLAPSLSAQHAAFRVKGYVRDEKGAPVANADVHVEAFYGYFAGAFGGGQRTFDTKTNAKGDWNVGGLQPGVWSFEVVSPNHVPETVILPIRILTTVSMGQSGMALTWELVLKPLPAGDDDAAKFLIESAQAARNGHADAVRTSLQQLPADADAEYLAGAGRVAMIARDFALARSLFAKAIERDRMSYRATLGLASTFLYDRDFDSASRAFDAARNRTKDKDEQRFISAAIGDLATIKVR
jgi:hypothetical protein